MEEWTVKHRKPIKAYVVSRDGRMDSIVVKRWKYQSLGHTIQTENIQIESWTQKQFASIEYDNILTVWDSSSGSVLWTHSSEYNTWTVTPDGTMLMSRQPEYKVRLWNAISGAILHDFSEQDDRGLFGTVFSPDSKLLAIARYDHVGLWDTRTGVLVHVGIPESWKTIGRRL
ncbi:hypothetical protein P171DRAFT_490461 [Karstenula rhodostoma CBS 690.94]|uniref:WD40 repeat-like protein n=1 Tax=Karstenula rhodostoma CBS 690.94 TaxID=1392251 RepID=A0A9P4U6E4_9PLEO|nr:hypothetical protein P171DRAFT_490461 [Karstenula rhodostoma CBS 690.94]